MRRSGAQFFLSSERREEAARVGEGETFGAEGGKIGQTSIEKEEEG